MDRKGEKTQKAQLSAVRIAINEVDEQMVTLIARRERLVRIAGTLKADKAAVLAPARVDQVIDRVRQLAAEKKVDPEVAEATYRAMISAFIELELRVQSHRA
ncbi:chorismate mutase [Paenarthrobacter sp. PH39-S1]|uniref:chorismate mutase n=1 Tax=Micrococcaceae TaxID=1268 RepID=UPI0024BABE50|nr:chorismate mutase [Paenarthrobacter sp. PH39-S1]MDJ0355477.1 chorismate mutase [Paenarthrobacter sp. PH39-S1]